MLPLASTVILACAVFASPARAQDDTAWLSVSTNEAGAHVYADSVYLGTAMQQVFSVEPGEIRVRVLPAERSSWSIDAEAATVVAVAGDTVSVSLPLPFYYRVESVPYDAQVFIDEGAGRRLVGETPVTFALPEPLERPIVLEKSGYLSTEIEPTTERWNRHMILLDRARRGEEAVAGAEVDWSPPGSIRSRWIDYAAVGLAVVSGVVAVHYKFKADDLYEHHQETGDPSVRDEIKRLDMRSGIALGVMQVGLGVFAIRLALR